MTILRVQTAALRLEQVTIALRRSREVLVKNLSVSILAGQVVTVMGPSGSGKSTLLAFVAGFLDRSAFEATGEIVVGGRELSGLPPEKRHVGMLFQDPVLFPHLSVGENLMFGLPRGGFKSRSARMATAADALASVGLDGFAGRDPTSLSGGQQARIALLRTLLAEPRALLLDEPFSRLDSALKSEIRRLVFRYAGDRGLPTLLVTHDPADAAAAGGPVIDLAVGCPLRAAGERRAARAAPI
jgi:putative thiamine transport system ATP-binding protein